MLLHVTLSPNTTAHFYQPLAYKITPQVLQIPQKYRICLFFNAARTILPKSSSPSISPSWSHVLPFQSQQDLCNNIIMYCSLLTQYNTRAPPLPVGNCPSTTCRFCPDMSGSLEKSGSPGWREGNVLLTPGLFLPEQEQSTWRKPCCCPGALQQLNKQEGWCQEVNNQCVKIQINTTTTKPKSSKFLPPPPLWQNEENWAPSEQILPNQPTDTVVLMPLSLYLVLLPQLLSVFLLHLQHSPPLCGILGVVELFKKKTEKRCNLVHKYIAPSNLPESTT